MSMGSSRDTSPPPSLWAPMAPLGAQNSPRNVDSQPSARSMFAWVSQVLGLNVNSLEQVSFALTKLHAAERGASYAQPNTKQK